MTDSIDMRTPLDVAVAEYQRLYAARHDPDDTEPLEYMRALKAVTAKDPSLSWKHITFPDFVDKMARGALVPADRELFSAADIKLAEGQVEARRSQAREFLAWSDSKLRKS